MHKIFIILLIFLLPCCQQESQEKNLTITLALNWFPEAEHGGYYAALVHGYYEEMGLDVNILPGGPGNTSLQQVAQQQIDFAVANADTLIMICAQEAKLSALMAPINKSPRSIMVHDDSSIHSVHDIQNMNLIISPITTFSAYMRKKLPLANVNIIHYQGSIANFLLDKNSAQQAYVFSEPFVAQSHGVKVRNLLIADELDYNPYTSILIAHTDSLEHKSDIVTKFVKASQKGWLKYLESPQKTNKYIHSINPEMTMEILDFGVEALKPLTQTNESISFGAMTSERWEKIFSQMQEAQVISGENIDTTKIFTNKFLD